MIADQLWMELRIYINKYICSKTMLNMVNRTFDAEIWCRLIQAWDNRTHTPLSMQRQNGCRFTRTSFKRIYGNNNFRHVFCPVGPAGPPDTVRALVALASVPGSGSTWSRLLVKRLTGTCTFVCVCTRKLTRHGYPRDLLQCPVVVYSDVAER